MRLIKPSGTNASDTRKGTLHGSVPKRRMAAAAGILRRGSHEKPVTWTRPGRRGR